MCLLFIAKRLLQVIITTLEKSVWCILKMVRDSDDFWLLQQSPGLAKFCLQVYRHGNSQSNTSTAALVYIQCTVIPLCKSWLHSALGWSTLDKLSKTDMHSWLQNMPNSGLWDKANFCAYTCMHMCVRLFISHADLQGQAALGCTSVLYCSPSGYALSGHLPKDALQIIWVSIPPEAEGCLRALGFTSICVP